jgi:imidazolonepropionase-like amidohydrolase
VETAYKAALVIDGVSEQPVEDGVVVIEDESIASVGSAANLSPDADVVDLGDVTLLPGLIDAHVHLVWNASAEPHELVAREGGALTASRCARSAALHLRAGITTVRDAGATDALSVDVAQAVELGMLPGPRVVAAGRVVAMTGGHAWFLGREADGLDAVRHAVRDELKGGAGCIKFMASGGSTVTPRSRAPRSSPSRRCGPGSRKPTKQVARSPLTPTR